MTDNLGKVRFTYLDYLFKEMYAVKSKYYPDSTFFKKDDKVILELEKSGTLWILYSVWSHISDMFSFDYEETQKLIKEWMEEQLKLGGVAPRYCFSEYYSRMEQQLKSEEITPVVCWRSDNKWAESQLKLEEITPRSAMAPPFRWRKLDSVKYAEIKPISNKFVEFRNAERRLESEEVTPRQVVNGSFDWMQDQIKLKEITPQVNSKQCFVLVGEQLNYEEQIIPEKTTCFVDSVRWKKIND